MHASNKIVSTLVAASPGCNVYISEGRDKALIGKLEVMPFTVKRAIPPSGAHCALPRCALPYVSPLTLPRPRRLRPRRRPELRW